MNPFFSSTPAPGYTQLHNQPSSDAEPPSSTWEDVNSLMSPSTQSTNTSSPEPPSIAQDQSTITATKQEHIEQHPPRYNDISGAVIIDWDGSPRFLSPQEEQERQTALENAVREKMLGLPRKTEFAWARPDVSLGDMLPAYEPATPATEKEKGEGVV
ncbi:uncharacterized protein EURHEDRAFT_415798 [Aspergillus ruber CBS 135680]|uniref:Uncharacterized protein n=1 Tax=Aspergillus ruber (strain CBS 135680) TaxID=1388766 RepID=A0A017S655_ASPRC|nr:uncharacterized protein EURHEDRAFT_415798 [Aspergillus ruber CBS 135680]EYE92089.1 hypothetical protein EURHEDRAFT_415798 [Aspergillus ruber CBS 135680]